MHGRNYDVLLLRPQEIKDVIDMKQAIDLVEQGYREAQGFPIINAPRRRVHSTRERAHFQLSRAAIDGLGVIGSLTRGEQVAHDPTSQEYPYREHPVYLLWNAEDRAAAMHHDRRDHREAHRLLEPDGAAHGGDQRRRLPPSGAQGCEGRRRLRRRRPGPAQDPGAAERAHDRDLQGLQPQSRQPEERSASGMATLVDASSCPSTRRARSIAGSDVVICATSSNVPVFDGAWLEPGQHLVTIVGSNSALVKGGWLKEGRRENDDETVRRADFIITNWRESIEQERQAGIFDPIEKGIITWDKIHELGEILDGSLSRPHQRRADHLARQQQRDRGGRPRDRPMGLRAVPPRWAAAPRSNCRDRASSSASLRRDGRIWPDEVA